MLLFLYYFLARTLSPLWSYGHHVTEPFVILLWEVDHGRWSYLTLTIFPLIKCHAFLVSLLYSPTDIENANEMYRFVKTQCATRVNKITYKSVFQGSENRFLESFVATRQELSLRQAFVTMIWSASTFRGARNLGVSVEPSLMKPHRGNMYRTCRLPRFSYIRSFNLTVLLCLMRTNNVLNAFEMLRTLHWLKMPRRACARYAMCQPCSNIVWWYNWVHTSRWATTWIVSQSCSNK